jgi:hypothetical protein
MKKDGNDNLISDCFGHDDKDLKRWLYDWSDDVLSDYDD